MTMMDVMIKQNSKRPRNEMCDKGKRCRGRMVQRKAMSLFCSNGRSKERVMSQEACTAHVSAHILDSIEEEERGRRGRKKLTENERKREG
jgi:hypothetical protein